MENKEKLFEDLQYVKRIIQDSRNIVVDSGIGFITWGVIIILGLFVTYLDIILQGDQYSIWAWIVLISAGWIQSIFDWYKKRAERTRVTFAGRLLGTIWLAVGISMTIVGFVGPFVGAYKSVYISPIISAILGIAFYISSLLYENKLMKFIPILWWVGSIYMFLFPGIQTILIMALLMLFLQVLPGILLYRKYKSERAANEG